MTSGVAHGYWKKDSTAIVADYCEKLWNKTGILDREGVHM
jgi:hypothetical protein